MSFDARVRITFLVSDTFEQDSFRTPAVHISERVLSKSSTNSKRDNKFPIFNKEKINTVCY